MFCFTNSYDYNLNQFYSLVTITITKFSYLSKDNKSTYALHSIFLPKTHSSLSPLLFPITTWHADVHALLYHNAVTDILTFYLTHMQKCETQNSWVELLIYNKSILNSENSQMALHTAWVLYNPTNNVRDWQFLPSLFSSYPK